mmetsp:Transcript_99856/g.242832  ORF Transcript_99856/g.242832 Transcript_99856/m.242832 type:complete len:94 (+) Transcript_99856:2-283(+)
MPTPPVALEYGFMSGPQLTNRATYWPVSDGGREAARRAIEVAPSLVDAGGAHLELAQLASELFPRRGSRAPRPRKDAGQHQQPARGGAQHAPK